MRARALIICVLLCSSAAFVAAEDHEVPIAVEPPQSLGAIVIRSGDEVRSVVVRGNTVLVPKDVAFPWTLGMMRFEAGAYTRADLQQKRPWVIRELGILRGRLQRPAPRKDERFAWVIGREETSQVNEIEFQPADDGSFEVRLPAGLYQGAVLGPTSASRIRSGIVVKPGSATDVGTILCEGTVPVSFRVIDAKRGGPIAAARVIWDPPGEVLNSNLSRALYARRWSGVTNAEGIATFATVGPLPLSVRWRVDAPSYASANTAPLQIAEPRKYAMPDVRLRPEAMLTVRVRLPRDAELFSNARLALGEPENERSLRYRGVAQTDLHEGETRFWMNRYGRKRVWIESKAGKKICYRDYNVTSEAQFVNFDLLPVDVFGKVTQRDQPVEGIVVMLADPQDPSVELGKARTDDDGEYRLTTYQSGELRLYTIASGGAGREIGPASKTLDVSGKAEARVDLELSTSGVALAVADAETGAPVKARIQKQFEFRDGSARTGWAETDDKGRMIFSALGAGKAKLHVQAKGYQTRDIEAEIREGAPEILVKLTRSRPIAGRVVDSRGAPIRGAQVMGGFDSELAMNPFLSAVTDGNGRFDLDSAPETGTLFYVVAPRYALGVATLQPDHLNTVVLQAPVAGVVTLREDNRIPAKVYMVMAVPAGGEGFIPLGVLSELAEANGMNPYQLHGSALDGAVVLPQFLSPGSYDLFIARRGGQPFIYQRIGTITTPIARNVVLAYASQ